MIMKKKKKKKYIKKERKNLVKCQTVRFAHRRGEEGPIKTSKIFHWLI